jgi:acyl-CoA reductase-like NAD-dependent aldehyde dehydrogenase
MSKDRGVNVDSLKMLINGQGVTSAQNLDVINPCNGEVAAQVPDAAVADLDEAITAAKSALADWSGDEALRKSVLLSIASVIQANQEALAQALSLETGLPLANTKDEVGMAAYFFKYRSKTTAQVETIHDDERQRVQVVRKPIGVVGAIIPWNAPMMIASEKISTAFAAGNTVVLKTSPLAPLSLLLLGQLLADKVPAGVLNILSGGDAVGKQMVADPRIGMISFTGSTEAGKAIMASGGATLKRLSLELGGNDPAIVLPDANPKKVASKLFWGAFYRSGQICAAIKRVYVHASMYDELVAAMAQLAAKITPADAFAEGALIGPLSNREQFEKVKGLLERSEAAGGRIATGGKALDQSGYYLQPTIVSHVDASNPLVREEQFGPLLPIIQYTDIDDAIAQANETEYGLGASVWSDDLEQAEAVAACLQAGSVWVNRHGIVMPDIPFGGFKHSGLGRANGYVGLDAYCELQTVSIAKPKPVEA